MDSQASQKLIDAVDASFSVVAASAGMEDPKIVFCQAFEKALKEIHKHGHITDHELEQYINSSEQVYLSALQQMNDPSPHSLIKGMRTSVQMFGPQFVIDPEIRNRLVMELGHCPVWAVVSTCGTDTLYAGLTFPEAMHRAQVEALEFGREASVVLRLEHFTGPPTIFEAQS